MLTFAEVVRQGSFTGAAAKLGVSKQAVSERVAQLEQSLGVKLLHRTTRSLRTTDAGSRYAKACSAMVALVTAANQEVRSAQIEPTGLLRVSVPVIYGRRFLGPVISEFMKRYPAVRIEVVLSNRQSHLIDDGIDLAVRVGELEDSSLVARRLGFGEVRILGSPEYLCQLGKLDASSIRKARTIAMHPRDVWPLGDEKWRVDPVLVVDDLELVVEAAASGIGLARLPSFMYDKAVAEGRLQVALPELTAERRPVHAVWPARDYMPLQVRLFIEALAASVDLER